MCHYAHIYFSVNQNSTSAPKNASKDLQNIHRFGAHPRVTIVIVFPPEMWYYSPNEGHSPKYMIRKEFLP